MVTAHAGVLTLPGGAVAQEQAVSQDRDARQIIERLQQQERDRAERFERSHDRPPSGEEAEVAAPAVATGEGCAAIRQVRLVGVTRYRPAEFAAATAELKGDCVGLAAID